MELEHGVDELDTLPTTDETDEYKERVVQELLNWVEEYLTFASGRDLIRLIGGHI